MKPNEIIPRQNRVIYTLMIVAAIIMLFYVLWKPASSDHKSILNRPAPTPTQTAPPADK